MTDRPQPAPPGASTAAALLLLAFVVQAGIAAVRDSVTVDEFVGLPVGLYTLQTGDVASESMNPPFFRTLVALPLLADPPVFAPEPGTPHWGLGYELMAKNPQAYHAFYLPARLIVILVAAALAGLVFHWAAALYGWPAGLVALTLFAFSPAMLAHGHLVTLDLAGAFGFVATLYACWRLLERPAPLRALLLGVALGVAPLLKLSGVVLFPIVAVLLTVRLASPRGEESRVAWLGYGVLAAVAALLVLNAAYGFRGTLVPGDAVAFEPGGPIDRLRATPLWSAIPLPLPFLRSIDMVAAGDPISEPTYFFAGELSETGWWYYHLAAFALKTPLPLLLAGGVALVLAALGRSRGRGEACLLVPIVFLLAANSLSNPLNIGVRHALPLEPLLMILASPILAAPLAARLRGRRDGRATLAAAVPLLLLVWYVGGTLAVAPRYLQYFNEIAGGERGGHEWLVDSNLDWGQDLIRLSEYMQNRGLPTVHLAYFGRVNPMIYGIHFRPLTRDSTGTAVVSPTFLVGRPYVEWKELRELGWSKSGAYTWLQRHEPVARVGALFVFELPADDGRARSLESGGSSVTLRKTRAEPPPRRDAAAWAP